MTFSWHAFYMAIGGDFTRTLLIVGLMMLVVWAVEESSNNSDHYGD